MKSVLLGILILLTFLSGGDLAVNRDKSSVNPIIGDESFVQIFGMQPDENTSNHLRIETHLCYVESKLRQQTNDRLPSSVKKKRLALLDALRTYWQAGVYPENRSEAERAPCFIDDDGRICAVGYLIEQSAGRSVAEHINDLFQYNELMTMDYPGLEEWAEKNGFTLSDLASIQPTYGSSGNIQTPDYTIKPEYATSSALLNGFNMGTAALSLHDTRHRALCVLGLTTGVITTTLGLYNLNDVHINHPNRISQRNLSLFNIVVGTSSLMLNAHRLSEIKHEQKKISLNMFGNPGLDGSPQMGLAIFARF